jgi:hypothetical protein
MDKNKMPNEVTYKFRVDNISKVLTDSEISGKYDFWLELDIFGVPYSAHKKISGCAGRDDVYYGTLKLVSDVKLKNASAQIFVPIVCYENFNNYKATDVPGKTVRSFEIEIPTAIQNTKLFLITSSHGANAGGEEYNRRTHHVYFDGGPIGTYIPGGKSCEPFRVYNTQPNGIYQQSPHSDAEWASFSNWCPGDVIPIRVYKLGNLNAGKHTFKIEVPDAKFVNSQGDIPLSAYIQGDKL